MNTTAPGTDPMPLADTATAASPGMRIPLAARSLVGLVLAALVVLTAAGNALASEPEPTSQTSVQVSPLDLTQQDTIQTVTVTVTNSSRSPMTRTDVSLRGPAGWTVGPKSVQIRRIDAGQRAHAVFDVRVPTLRDGFRTYPFTATITYNGGDGVGEATQERTLTSGDPLGSLDEARTNVGVTSLEDASAGDFDGEGNSFSAEALEAEGVTPGATLDGAGTEFTWPDVASDEADNATASGQAIEIGRSGDRIAFLASGSGLDATGTVTVHYTDGSTSEGTLAVPNWTGVGANPEAEVVAASEGRNRPDGYGDESGTYSLFATSVDVDPGKEIELVVLPANASIHVFDMVVVG